MPLAQLDRATAFYAVGRGFESLKARHMEGLAQLVSASGCGPEGRGFESHISPQKKALAIAGAFFYKIYFA